MWKVHKFERLASSHFGNVLSDFRSAYYAPLTTFNLFQYHRTQRYACLKGGNVIAPPSFLRRIKNAPIHGVLKVAKRDDKH